MMRASKETTRQVLDVVPLIMRTIRVEMRRNAEFDLSVPQFRALGFVERHPGASLSDVAEHIGLTLPAMSKLIDGLVERKLVTRASQVNDRRRLTLALTLRGRALLQSAHDATHAFLAERLAGLSEEDHTTVIRAMQILEPLFTRHQVGECNENS